MMPWPLAMAKYAQAAMRHTKNDATAWWRSSSRSDRPETAMATAPSAMPPVPIQSQVSCALVMENSFDMGDELRHGEYAAVSSHGPPRWRPDIMNLTRERAVGARGGYRSGTKMSANPNGAPSRAGS